MDILESFTRIGAGIIFISNKTLVLIGPNLHHIIGRNVKKFQIVKNGLFYLRYDGILLHMRRYRDFLYNPRRIKHISSIKDFSMLQLGLFVLKYDKTIIYRDTVANNVDSIYPDGFFPKFFRKGDEPDFPERGGGQRLFYNNGTIRKFTGGKYGRGLVYNGYFYDEKRKEKIKLATEPPRIFWPRCRSFMLNTEARVLICPETIQKILAFYLARKRLNLKKYLPQPIMRVIIIETFNGIWFY